jgi:hypothetical protein
MRPSSCQLHSRTTGLACDPRHDRLPFVFICFHLSPCQKSRGRQIQHLSSLGQRQSGRVQCRGNDECDRARRNCCCPRYHRRKRSKAEGGHGQPVQKLSHSSSAFPIKSHACLPLVRSRIMQPADMGISSRRADTRTAICMVRSPETVAVSLTSASRRHEQVPGRSPSRGWRPVGHNDIARGSLVLHGGIESAAELRPHQFAAGNRRTSSGSVYVSRRNCLWAGSRSSNRKKPLGSPSGNRRIRQRKILWGPGGRHDPRRLRGPSRCGHADQHHDL